MNYLLLADIVTVLHTALIFLVLIGILVSARYKRFRPIEASVLLIAVVIWSLYDGCPLTYLENFLRTTAEHPTALLGTGFIPYYFDHWFGIFIDKQQLTVATYITAGVFSAVSLEWVSPFINIEIKKVWRFISRRVSK